MSYCKDAWAINGVIQKFKNSKPHEENQELYERDSKIMASNLTMAGELCQRSIEYETNQIHKEPVNEDSSLHLQVINYS